MKALNLTHGGFYTHFKSKGAVLGARLQQVETALRIENDDEQSVVLMSTLAGARALARSVESAQLATRLLNGVRASLKKQISAGEKAGQ